MTKIPRTSRFFGPENEALSAVLATEVFRHPHLLSYLMQFAVGEIEPQELGYEIQCLFEDALGRIRPGAEDFDERTHSSEPPGDTF